MASVLETVKRLNKEYQNDHLAIRADLSPKYERCASGAMGFDFPLFGGLPEGRVCIFSGQEHSGKTTAACVVMAAYQRKYPKKTCVFIDVEHALDKEFTASVTGVDWTKVYYVNPENMSGEDVLDVAHDLLQADDIGCLILDSVAALVSKDDYETDVADDKGMRSSMAKPLNKFLKKILDKVSVRKSIPILINQVRLEGKTRNGAPIYYELGGKALQYYTSVAVRFGRRTFTCGDVVDKHDGEKADGFRLWFAITKNKTASTQRGGGFMTFRYDEGLDWMNDLLEIALKYEFIQRPTSQSYLLVNLETGEVYKDEDGRDLRFVGKGKVREYFNAHIDFQRQYLEMLNNHISKSENKYQQLLDSRQLADIKAEEQFIEDISGITDDE